MLNGGCPWPGGWLYRHRADRGMGISCYIIRRGSTQVCSSATSPIDIIDNRYIIDDGRSMDVLNIIIAHVDIGNMVAGTKDPIVGRWPVTAEGDADIYPGSYGRPAVIASVLSPGDPGRGPFISRHPHPSIVIVVEPVAIMKRRPTPAITRYPGPAFVSIDPVPAGAILTEIAASCRHPYISIIRIIHPGAIRAELIIKDLEADAGLSLGRYLPYPGDKAC